MNILSIQSHVAYGHVGNASAVFPMQRLGVEVWPIHTVQFSNHTGYGAWTGRVFEAPMIEELVEASPRAACLRLRRRAVGLHGLGRHRQGDPFRGRAGARGQPRRALLLRSGDRRCRARRLRAPGIPEFMREHACRRPTSSRPTSSNSNICPSIDDETLAGVKEAVAAVQRTRARSCW